MRLERRLLTSFLVTIGHIVSNYADENQLRTSYVRDNQLRIRRDSLENQISDDFEPEHHHFTNNVKLGNLDQVNQDFGHGSELGPTPPKLTGPNVCTKQEP